MKIQRKEDIISKLDWVTVLLFLVLVLMGWLNIFAAVYDENAHKSIFDLSLNSGKQLMWIGTTVILIVVLMLMDYKFYDSFAYIIYGGIMLLLIFVLLFGREVAGSKSWFEIGSFRLQPAEFAKFACALGVAKYLGDSSVKMDKIKHQLALGVIVAIPVLLIMLQGDTGTAMVFSMFMIVFYREGMSPVLIILGLSAGIIFTLTLLMDQTILMISIGVLGVILIVLNRRSFKKIALIAAGTIIVIGVVISVDFIITDVMKPHQQNRVKALINPEADPLGYGWNVTQSKIAIGSGGLIGKGFLEGTQTKFDFVPEQSTDFIFCTIGEEHGWIGSVLLIILFMALLLRIVFIAERQKSRFARVYGYSVASIFFFHFGVNIGMTIGLFPVVGIPLPFFSYGGSSLWSFTIFLFILVKLDAHRSQMLTR
jgi:rod shape determining protein RodA